MIVWEKTLKGQYVVWAWCCPPLISALGKQRQVGSEFRLAPLDSEFEDSQDYVERPCLQKKSGDQGEPWKNLLFSLPV